MFFSIVLFLRGCRTLPCLFGKFVLVLSIVLNELGFGTEKDGMGWDKLGMKTKNTWLIEL